MKVSTFTSKEMIDLFEKKSQEYMYCLFPAIINLIDNPKNKKILDIGCGGGVLDFELSKLGSQVIGIDKSKGYIDICNERFSNINNLNFKEMDGRNLSSMDSNYFDYVILNMVLLALERKKDLEEIFSEASRVLKSGGCLIFSDLHPICKMISKQPTRSIVYSKEFSYFKEGVEFKTVNKLLNGQDLSLVNKHWTIKTYMNLINLHNFKLIDIVEPKYNEEAPKVLKKYNFPDYIIFNCEKI